MLTPEEATPRALAFLTLSHEMYSSQDDPDALARYELSEDEVRAVLSDDDGEVDWEAISVALGMIGHVLIDMIPETLYTASEQALTQIIANHFGASPDDVTVTINNRLTGTSLLRMLSLRVMAMEASD